MTDSLQEELKKALQEAYDSGFQDGQQSSRREIQLGLNAINRKLLTSLELPIEDLDLSERSSTCLRRARILTIDELVSKTEEDLLKITNFGRRSLDEVVPKLAQRGLKLREE